MGIMSLVEFLLFISSFRSLAGHPESCGDFMAH